MKKVKEISSQPLKFIYYNTLIVFNIFFKKLYKCFIAYFFAVYYSFISFNKKILIIPDKILYQESLACFSSTKQQNPLPYLINSLCFCSLYDNHDYYNMDYLYKPFGSLSNPLLHIGIFFYN